jgi:O-antigen/teichoic acid export membrane protein
LQKIKYNIYADYIFSSSVQLILVILFYSMGFDITWVAIAYSLSMAFSFFFILYFSRRNLLSVSGSKTVSYTREMFAYSLPLAVGSFASIAIISIDTIFLGIFRTATETGVYNAAMPTASIIYLFASAFSILFFPILTELYSKRLMPELKTFYTTVTRWIFIVTLPFLLTFMIFSDNMLGILFGPEYVYGATALSILSLMYFISSIFSTSTFVLLVMKKTRYVMINVVSTTLIICIGNVILTPVYGIYGAAIVSLIASVFMNSLLFIEVRYFAKLSPFCFKTMAKSVLAGVASVALIYFLYKGLHLQSSLPLFILLFSLLILLYFLILLVLRCFSRNDLMMMSSIEKKLGIKSRFLRSVIKRFIR